MMTLVEDMRLFLQQMCGAIGMSGTAMNVVDTSDPESSLILRKPTSSAESEGVANSGVLAHGGGIRFAKDSPEYLTILQWIKGAKE